MRYRLITARGRPHSFHIWGDQSEALLAAAERYTETQIPVLVCEAPEGGIVRQLCIVGDTKPAVKPKIAKAT